MFFKLFLRVMVCGISCCGMLFGMQENNSQTKKIVLVLSEKCYEDQAAFWGKHIGYFAGPGEVYQAYVSAMTLLELMRSEIRGCIPEAINQFDKEVVEGLELISESEMQKRMSTITEVMQKSYEKLVSARTLVVFQRLFSGRGK